MTMNDVERLARVFAADERNLRYLLVALQAEIDESRKRAMKNILAAVGVAQAGRADLEAALKESKHLFVKPRTLTIDGIKFGWQKQKGRIEFADAEQVCRLIRKHLPGMADALIETTERPLKDALAQLPAAELKRLGVKVTDDSDAVMIKDVAGDIEKLVAALVNGKAEG